MTPTPMLTLIREYPVWTAVTCVVAVTALWFAWEVRHAPLWPDDGPLDHALASYACGPQDRAGATNTPPRIPAHPLPSEGRREPSSAPRLLTLHADSDHDAAEALIRAVGGWREAA